MKKNVTVAFILLAFAASLSLVASHAGTGTPAALSSAGFATEPPAAPTAELVDANGDPVNFDTFKGKVVFVNNWATWCGPCIAEMPGIAALKSKLKGEDVVFVMVSFDRDPSKAQAWMKKRGYDFEVYFPGEKYPYRTSSIPATFILNPSGELVSKHIGMADFDSDEIAEKLKALAE